MGSSDNDRDHRAEQRNPIFTNNTETQPIDDPDSPFSGTTSSSSSFSIYFLALLILFYVGCVWMYPKSESVRRYLIWAFGVAWNVGSLIGSDTVFSVST